MKRGRSTETSRQAILQLCYSALDSATLRRELLRHLRAIIPFDYAYFSATDPATLLGTNAVIAEPPPAWLMPVYVENEFLQADFNKFTDMLRDQQPTALLSQVTRNELEISPRYRDMLLPLAMSDELRAIFVSDASCWGTLCLHRQQAQAGYTAEESGFLAQLAPHIADGLRRATLVGMAVSTPTATPDGPGVLILSDDLSTIAATAAAGYWLAELTDMEGGDKHLLPLAVRSVTARLLAIERGAMPTAMPTAMPKVRLHMRSGQWLVLYASRLKGASDQPQISVIFEIAQPAEIAPLIMQAYQLTKREGEITQSVLLGWSTSEISAALHISANTVQDHLKAIFEKVDVSSRGELAARIFRQQYQPRFQAISE
ncbi:MAG: helix-turn-helix transcriptional regulator [Anaerolineae bacterium]